MKELLQDIKADGLVWRGTIAATILLLICIIYTGIAYYIFPPVIPLFHQLPWGEQRLAEKIGIVLPVGFTFCTVYINVILATMIHKTLPLVGRILIITSLLLTILLSIFLIKTTLLVI